MPTTNTTLEGLKNEGRQQLYDFPGKYWLDTVNVSIAHGKLCNLLDAFAEKVYAQAIQDAIAVLWNDANIPDLSRLQALLPTNETV